MAPACSASRTRPTERGFTYLFVLFFVAMTAAALAALGQSWSTAAERERERELEFRGEQIARAIVSYQKAAPQQQLSPRNFDELLEDRRVPNARHHLRQLYSDPMTGKPDWVLIPDPGDKQRFIGVHSASERELLRTRRSDGQALHLASEREFRASDFDGGAAAAPIAAASSPASASAGN
ncbi:MAG TPA: type II secretion system protein [Burkholderiaceae bacterium]|jgi:type II secretory pathway pseudopilin PulG